MKQVEYIFIINQCIILSPFSIAQRSLLVLLARSFLSSSCICIYFIFNVHPFDNRAPEPQRILSLLSDTTGTEVPTVAMTNTKSLLLLISCSHKSCCGGGRIYRAEGSKILFKRSVNILSIVTKSQV